MIPYADIAENADRKWTFRLLDRLRQPDLADAEFADLEQPLCAASDPRSVAPLEAILTDCARPAAVRRSAGFILREMCHLSLDVPERTLRSWWAKGDDVLRDHALRCMGGSRCPDIVVALAADPTNEWHAAGLDRMDFGFDTPECQRLKIAALSHPGPDVRATGAWVLLWDEPVVAEGPLNEASQDTEGRVIAAAADALKYYPTVRTARRLHALLGHADERVQAEAGESFAELRNEFLIRLCGCDRRVADRVRCWLAAIWDVLAFADEELTPDKPSESRSRSCDDAIMIPTAELLAVLADPDASPNIIGDRLWKNRWEGYDDEARRRLRPILLGHGDPLVRNRASLALAAWGDADGLLELLADPDFVVRKSAAYRLGQLSPSPRLAAVAWDHLFRPDVSGVQALELLDTYFHHADPAEAIPRLAALAADPNRRESLRVSAVSDLARLGAAAELRALFPLLREPPPMTWSLHVALLNAAADLGPPLPDIAHLRDIDHLHIQESLARFD